MLHLPYFSLIIAQSIFIFLWLLFNHLGHKAKKLWADNVLSIGLYSSISIPFYISFVVLALLLPLCTHFNEREFSCNMYIYFLYFTLSKAFKHRIWPKCIFLISPKLVSWSIHFIVAINISLLKHFEWFSITLLFFIPHMVLTSRNGMSASSVNILDAWISFME